MSDRETLDNRAETSDPGPGAGRRVKVAFWLSVSALLLVVGRLSVFGPLGMYDFKGYMLDVWGKTEACVVILSHTLGLIALIVAIVVRVKTGAGESRSQRNLALGALLTAVVTTAILCTSLLLGAVANLHCSACRSSLRGLYMGIRIYENDWGQGYPVAERWCDDVIERGYPGGLSTRRQLQCPADEPNSCSYAINPRCEPNSPSDTVLLFETPSGWNQHGGAELITFTRHRGHACILINDGSVMTITPADVNDLIWGEE